MNVEVVTTPTRGILLVVAAPSGAGKSTLVNALLEQEPGMDLSISYTTRRPRLAESEGRHYHFIDRSEFEQRVAAGEFLEHAEVHGNLYGTSHTAVEQALVAGRDLVLEIDWQGARQIRALLPCIGIFILPPSRDELERRLRVRDADSEAVIEFRLRNLREEIRHTGEFDYLLVNDRFEGALENLRSIVHAVRLQRDHMLPSLQTLLHSLLKGG